MIETARLLAEMDKSRKAANAAIVYGRNPRSNRCLINAIFDFEKRRQELLSGLIESIYEERVDWK